MSHLNGFIQNLPSSDIEMLRPLFKAKSFGHGDVIAEAGQPIEDVWFVNSGMLSVIVPLQTGEAIEAGVVGADEVFGASGAFGMHFHINTAVGQMPGSAFVIACAALKKAVARSTTLSHALAAQEQFLLAQAQQTAACNARHAIPQRLATWLLRVRDRSQRDELNLTQEFLSQMLGVQRASVSIAAAQMQQSGLIRYKRGNVRIMDLQGLEQAACECYSAVRDQYQRTIQLVDRDGRRAGQAVLS